MKLWYHRHAHHLSPLLVPRGLSGLPESARPIIPGIGYVLIALSAFAFAGCCSPDAESAHSPSDRIRADHAPAKAEAEVEMTVPHDAGTEAVEAPGAADDPVLKPSAGEVAVQSPQPPALRFVPEMEPVRFAEDLTFGVPAATDLDEVVGEFNAAWEQHRVAIENAVTMARLTEISRWAVSRMDAAEESGVAAPADWTRNLPWSLIVAEATADPVGGESEDQIGARGPENAAEPLPPEERAAGIAFSFGPEASPWRLPSHSPLVQRSVVLFALFDVKETRIAEVIITIRGWAEE